MHTFNTILRNMTVLVSKVHSFSFTKEGPDVLRATILLGRLQSCIVVGRTLFKWCRS